MAGIFSIADFDFDYYWTSLSSTTGTNDDLSSTKISSSLAYNWLRQEISGDKAYDEANNAFTQQLIFTLSFEQIGVTNDEAGTTLKDEAKAVLQRGNLMSFFSACGPGYIRSVKKSAELAVIFSWPTLDEQNISGFFGSLMTDIESAVQDNAETDIAEDGLSGDYGALLVDKYSIENWLTIRMTVIGIAPSGYSTGDMTALTIRGVLSISKHVFEYMSDDAAGTTTGVEVVPWTENPDFRKEMIDLNLNLSPIAEYYMMANAEFICGLDEVARKWADTFEKIMKCKRGLAVEFTSNQNVLLSNQLDYYIDPSGAYTCAATSTAFNDGTEIKDNDLKFIHVQRLKDFLSNTFTTNYIASYQLWVTHYYTPCVNKLNDINLSSMW
eukprot:CAMPEP_0113325632 /NCGR_PEP_ID=MMETSP0010_2-20120614/17902_1 /TAXON_ID=216773 ORGANISM="Corethron hystrix, Strain 308" /NCGR_SAMPLE_ID=MMETSP0010_2 /ASSEMBLY_ACC=CAM_ASM_000155 /LENGTH=382 /DNA_ID=CAMNT_0000185531 /DNA_START=487 /DNA_END=1633 /DNA_ORIENTATION=- /assembly_acc=CAM_ASM_000155